MKTMKNVAYALAAAVMAVPAFVSAQVGLTGGDLMGSAGTSGLTAGQSLSDYAVDALNWIIAIVGFLAILGFLISAVMYFTAAGDEDKITKAKSAMTYSIIGVVVALMGFVIMNVVQNFLSAGTL
jgi:hypothetical protein